MAIDDVGLSNDPKGLGYSLGGVSYYEGGETGKAMKIAMWGMHISTRGIDAGVRIGRIETTYFLRDAGTKKGTGTPTKDDVVEWVGGLAAGKLNEVSAQKAGRWPETIAAGLRRRNAGLGMGVNQMGLDAWVGVNETDALVIPRDENVLVLMRSGSETTEDDFFLWKEE